MKGNSLSSGCYYAHSYFSYSVNKYSGGGL